MALDVSARMKRVRRDDTALELELRRALWARGVRYRVRPKGVEGRPDIGVKGRRVAVFIDGCFWHGCPTCKDYPRSNRKFWEAKFRYNRARRKQVRQVLERTGWRVVEAWEHDIRRDLDSAVRRVARALTNESSPGPPIRRHRRRAAERKV